MDAEKCHCVFNADTRESEKNYGNDIKHSKQKQKKYPTTVLAGPCECNEATFKLSVGTSSVTYKDA